MTDAAPSAAPERYVLRLYVVGSTTRSADAVRAIRDLCREHLAGRYELEVIDIQKHPQLARDEQIFAVPTLVKRLPAPLRHLIGDLSDRERVILGLDLRHHTERGLPHDPDDER